MIIIDTPSMRNRKMQQTIEAMVKILGEMRPRQAFATVIVIAIVIVIADFIVIVIVIAIVIKPPLS